MERTKHKHSTEKICYYCGQMVACGYQQWFCNRKQDVTSKHSTCEYWEEE